MTSISGQAVRPLACKGTRLQSRPGPFRTHSHAFRSMGSTRLQRHSRMSNFQAAAQGVSTDPGKKQSSFGSQVVNEPRRLAS